MPKNDAFILALAYPDTIVRISEERIVSYLKYINVGCENYVRAGHAALVLIDKETGDLDYYDFGRYTCPLGYGRVRGKITDNELDFPLKAKIEDGRINNLNEILNFLATNPDLTHGEGKLIGSVCDAVNYKKAKDYITQLQNGNPVRYGAFIKKASNCSRFVTDTLIASINDNEKKKRLIKSKRFTPSTISNVIIANTEHMIHEVSESGHITEFTSTLRAENKRCFLDELKDFEPNLVGNLEPKPVKEMAQHAQWLEGIGAGAWFEIYDVNSTTEFRFRRISPYGNIDCDGIYEIDSDGFDINSSYQFVHYSNCSFFHIEQNAIRYRFEFTKNYES
ncbi:DUF6695 family protein [Winogradskyella schleiferi]|uniref:DUF6695 family protein n=1 Tax=Winogradskyella schleiferi TaxID=2686078 RepID=UPI0015BE4B68|nr:DUF6695 family protein [Winogradskyella schleiferi]